MAHQDLALQLDELLEHRDFIRRLAFHLVGDEHQADDLTQEVLIAALERRPKSLLSIRAWLSSVTRNLAANSARANRNRQTREMRVAEVAPKPASDVNEEFALQRQVASAVDQLDEPYRSTILLRYFKELSHAEIASETGAPLATVRSRLKRGLAKLREQLDRHCDNDRAVWQQGLALLIGKDLNAPTSLTSGGLQIAGVSMTLLVKIGIGITLAVLATLGLISEDPPSGPKLNPHQEEVTEVPGEPFLDGVAVEMEAFSSSRKAVEPEPERTTSKAEGDSSKGHLGNTHIRGRVVLPGGAPAFGATIKITRIFALGSNTPNLLNPSEAPGQTHHTSWDDLVATSDTNGDFELHFELPEEHRMEMTCGMPGYATYEFSLRRSFPGGEIDVETVKLRELAAIEGRVLDTKGNPTGLAWNIVASGKGMMGFGGNWLSPGTEEILVTSDAETGEFRLEGIPAGRLNISAEAMRVAHFSSPNAVAIVGETVHLDLIYDGPNPATTILLYPGWPVFNNLEVTADSIRIQGANYDSALDADSSLNEGKTWGFKYLNIPSGTYTVTIDDPRFETLVIEDVTPGQTLSPKLVPNGAIQLTVTDGVSGEPLLEAALSVQLNLQIIGAEPIQVQAFGPLPANGLITAYPPGDSTLIVEVPGFALQEIKISGLAPWATQNVQAELFAPSSLTGIVTDSSGLPLEGARVLVMPKGAPPALLMEETLWLPDDYVNPIAETRTDSDGRYLFDSFAPCEFDAYACETPWNITSSLSLEVLKAESKSVHFQLASAASAEITVTGLASTAHSDFALVLTPELPMLLDNQFAHPRSSFTGGAAIVEPDEDGVYRVSGLPAGKVAIQVVRGQVHYNFGPESMARLGTFVHVGEMTLALGQVTSATFETPVKTGSIAVRFHINGEPLGNKRIKINFIDDTPGLPPHLAEISSGWANTDSLGRVTFSGLFPGKYKAQYGVGNSDTISSPVAVSLSAGGAQSILVDFVPAEGELVLLNQDGTAKKGGQIWVKGPSFTGTVRLNALGRVMIELPAGDYSVTDWSEPDLEWPLTWPAEPMGPIQVQAVPMTQ